MCLIRFPFWKAKQFDQYGRRKCQVQGCISVGICCAGLHGLSLVRNFVSFMYIYVIVFSGNAELRQPKGCRTCLFLSFVVQCFLSFFFLAVFCSPCWWASQQLSWTTRHLLPGLFPGNGSILFQKRILAYSFGVKRGWSVGTPSYTSVKVLLDY